MNHPAMKKSLASEVTTMLDVFLIAVLVSSCMCLIEIPVIEDNNELLICISQLLSQSFTQKNVLTIVDINYDDNSLAKAINLMTAFPLITRIPKKKTASSNEGYIITAGTIKDFVNHFSFLTKDVTWNPYARFIIIIKTIDSNQRSIFDILLQYHVINVLIVNGTSTAELYTYNPFDNYKCGKWYDHVIEYGQCFNNSNELFPNKLSNGLRNCTFNVGFTHWPPYAVDPLKFDTQLKGLDQFVLDMISEKEQFKINYSNSYSGEEFSTISSEMIASGPMALLQTNMTDIVLGGFLLIKSRYIAFGSIYTYLPFTDEIRIMVKKATHLPTWMIVYLEFEPEVWFLIITTFLLVSILVVLLFRAKGVIILRMFDYFTLHGSVIKGRFIVKYMFLMWILFTFLINSFYQSSLVSLMTHRAKEFQITTEKEIAKHKLKPCFSTIIKKFIYVETKQTFHTVHRIQSCSELLASVRTVGNNKGLYTAIMYSMYLYSKQTFQNKWGEPMVYPISKPFAKVIYSIYTYKGFPMLKRLNLISTKLRENGLMEMFLKSHYHSQMIKTYFHWRELEPRFAIPWHVYIIGCSISALTFVLEVLSKYKT